MHASPVGPRTAAAPTPGAAPGAPARSDSPLATPTDRLTLDEPPRAAPGPALEPASLDPEEERLRPLRPGSQAVQFVATFNQGLPLSPEERLEKDRLMRESAMMFFKASPALFYQDLRGPYAEMSRLCERPCPPGVLVADPHLLNFGTFRGADGKAVWGLNDFDQAGRGPLEWDLERLAVSVDLLARQCGLSKSEQKEALDHLGECYFDTMTGLARGRDLGPAWLEASQCRGPVRRSVEAAAAVDPDRFVLRFLDSTPEGWAFKTTEELQPVPARLREEVAGAVAGYAAGLGDVPGLSRPLEVLAVARKLGSGGSSFGLERYYVAVRSDLPDRPLLLEVKQILPCPLDSPSPDLARADAAATVDCQRKLGGLANPLTGAGELHGTSVLIREREAEKSNLWPDGWGKAELLSAVEQAARVLARAHARTPAAARAVLDWAGPDRREVLRNLRHFARTSSAQAREDWEAFREADPAEWKLAR